MLIFLCIYKTQNLSGEHTHTHTHTLARTHARTHTYTHARTHAHCHAHTHARTHARTSISAKYPSSRQRRFASFFLLLGLMLFFFFGQFCNFQAKKTKQNKHTINFNFSLHKTCIKFSASTLSSYKEA